MHIYLLQLILLIASFIPFQLFACNDFLGHFNLYQWNQESLSLDLVDNEFAIKNSPNLKCERECDCAQEKKALNFSLTTPIPPSVGLFKYTYKTTMRKHYEDKYISSPRVVVRGDSRFPWKIWESGGIYPKGKDTNQFSVDLHQSAPSTNQNVLSTSSNIEVGKKYATAMGHFDHLYLKNLEKYPHVDQSDKIWERNQGYCYALHVDRGVDLNKRHLALKKDNPYDYFLDKSKKYQWEKEFAVLGGVEKEFILGVRPVTSHYDDPEKNWVYTNKFNDFLYLNKNLFRQENQSQLIQTISQLLEIEEKVARTFQGKILK